MSMEARMTVCNMSIEAGGRAGMVAPDETTFAYIANRPFAPKGAAWDEALAYWKTLPTDAGATFDKMVALDASQLAPMVTWGTSPEHALPVTSHVPDPLDAQDETKRAEIAAALDYMALKPGMQLTDIEVDRVFIGSCTNSRIEDLRAAAAVARLGRAKVTTWVVPGSRTVQRQAEQEGLDRIFTAAGFEWREPGCSLCTAINGDQLRPGSAARRLPTVISAAARARAAERTWSARRWLRPRHLPAASPMCVNSRNGDDHAAFHYDYRNCSAAR